MCAMDPIQQRSIAQLCTRCSTTSSTGWQIHRWKPSSLIFPARSDFKATYPFSHFRQSQAFSTAFPLICGRASEEVRKSISVDLMSSLSTNQKIDLLVDSDEEEVTLFWKYDGRSPLVAIFSDSCYCGGFVWKAGILRPEKAREKPSRSRCGGFERNEHKQLLELWESEWIGFWEVCEAAAW